VPSFAVPLERPRKWQRYRKFVFTSTQPTATCSGI
jgi:hypothetical protein